MPLGRLDEAILYPVIYKGIFIVAYFPNLLVTIVVIVQEVLKVFCGIVYVKIFPLIEAEETGVEYDAALKINDAPNVSVTYCVRFRLPLYIPVVLVFIFPIDGTVGVDAIVP